MSTAESQPDPEQQTRDEILDYLRAENQQFALQELTHHQAISCFLPLLHEMFGGSQAKARIVFAILHGLMLDDRVRWSRAEIDEKFHWLREGHRTYLLHRLSQVGWLEYYRDQSAYMISDRGEALMRILNRCTLGDRLVEHEGAALAEIEFSQLLEENDISDQLHFLSNRLRKHNIRAEHALSSRSAYLILEIYQQLRSAHRWSEQTRVTLDRIELDDDDARQWHEVRNVHDLLSHLHSLISRMQLELQDIQRKQIDIARYGLTHLDFDNYLLATPLDELAITMRQHLQKVPHPFLLMDANVYAEAGEILERNLLEQPGARGWETAVQSAGAEEFEAEPREAMAFTADLGKQTTKWQPLRRLMATESWEIAAYRFQLLTLMADRDARTTEAAAAAMDPIVATPVEVDFEQTTDLETVEVDGQVRQMSRGRIRRVSRRQSQKE